jgi:hypothetical protein
MAKAPTPPAAIPTGLEPVSRWRPQDSRDSQDFRAPGYPIASSFCRYLFRALSQSANPQSFANDLRAGTLPTAVINEAGFRALSVQNAYEWCLWVIPYSEEYWRAAADGAFVLQDIRDRQKSRTVDRIHMFRIVHAKRGPKTGYIVLTGCDPTD